MKTPPFLLGAALVFWGWQTGLEIPGAIMGGILEAARWTKARWDLSDEDFSRIWTFCTLLFLASAVYAFTANEGPSQFRSLFDNPNFLTQRNAGTATARTAASLFRWLPLVFFLFAAAQIYSAREGVPIETISLILSRRWSKARKKGQARVSGHTVNVSYYYFGLCLVSASIHSAEENTSFFWGIIVLVGYALWWNRPKRFAPGLWVICMLVAVGFGYAGQKSIGHFQGYLGNLNAWWLTGFGRGRHDPTQSRTDLGKVGRIKTSGKIVIRVQTPEGGPPGLLREASYRRFNGQTWFADLSEKDYITLLEDTPNSSSYQLIRGKTNTLTVNIGCYLEGGKALLPLPSGTARLEHLTAFTLAKNPLGAVFDEGPGLVVFDAMYGPGQTIDSSPDDFLDTNVPSRDREAVDEVLQQIGLSEPDAPKAIKAINAYFMQHFSYSLFQPGLKLSRTNETPLTRFLLRTHKGHCEYFASAGVLLLRELKIPARYAVGYAVHEGANGKYVVRQRDAHAWCLVWDEKHTTWRDVDFTPPSWVQLETAGQGRLQALADFWERFTFELSKIRWGQSHLRQYLLLAVIPVLAILLYQIVFKSRKRRKGKMAGARSETIAWPGLDSEFYRVEQVLSQRGLQRRPSQPLSELLEWCNREGFDPQLKLLLAELLSMHYRYRFDPNGLNSRERDAFRRRTSECMEQLRGA